MRDYLFPLLIFAVIILAFFGVHFVYLYNNSHTDLEYLKAFIILFPASLVVGYIYIVQLLEENKRHTRNMEHLVKEVLHEINLPISTIKANISMLKRSENDTKMQKRLDRIDRATVRLEKLYRELSYNIKREIMPIAKEEFDLKDVIIENCEFFKELKRNPILLDLESSIVVSDKIGFMQVFDNILENAFKYSDSIETPIKIVLKNAILSIEDRGIGMDESEILKVYERYYQGSSSSAGEGIGLAIVKRYCDEEGIYLKIESKKGEGTKVIMDFGKLYC